MSALFGVLAIGFPLILLLVVGALAEHVPAVGRYFDRLFS